MAAKGARRHRSRVQMFGCGPAQDLQPLLATGVQGVCSFDMVQAAERPLQQGRTFFFLSQRLPGQSLRFGEHKKEVTYDQDCNQSDSVSL